jgi:hypothetical protein
MIDETSSRRVEQHFAEVVLSDLFGILLIEEIIDERGAWSTSHLTFAENAGSSKQGHTCMMTDLRYYLKWACNGFRRLQGNEAHAAPIWG